MRDLLRCREAVRRDVLRWRHRVVKFLDRHGRRYLAGKNWTQRHWTWLRQQQFALPVLQRTLQAALFALEQALACGGPRRILGAVTEPHAVRRLLAALGLAAQPPPAPGVPAP